MPRMIQLRHVPDDLHRKLEARGTPAGLLDAPRAGGGALLEGGNREERAQARGAAVGRPWSRR